MNHILTANIPEIVRISLIALLFSALISGILLIVGYVIQNAKLAEFSLKVSAISTLLMFISFITVPLGSQYLTDSAIYHHRYEIEKTDDQIIIKSLSPWLKSETYEIVGHKNETYYLKSEKGLKEIKENDLK